MSKSAGINFGIPDSEYIVRVDGSGAATSCYNQDTETEYIGGGGGGDFSTAEVTYTVGNLPGTWPSAPVVFPDALVISSFASSSTGTYVVPLYKGKLFLTMFDVIVTGSGNISIEGEDGEYEITITGNCTIDIQPYAE